MIKKIYLISKGVTYRFDLLISRLIRLFSKILAIPIVLGITFVSPFVRIRLINLFSSRIGHYSINTELILCALDMKLDNDKHLKTLFYTEPNQPICNLQLHQMWKRVIPISPFSTVAADVDSFLLRIGGKAYRNSPIKTLQIDCRDRYNFLERIKKCHLTFTPKEEERGRELTKELGVPFGAPFVCLLVRDSNYLNTYMPSVDWSYHIYRDAEISTYRLAANYLAERGYFVIRMGKAVKEPFLADDSRIIDYANSQLRSDFMDIYLSAHCSFFLSTCTGLDSVARVFRKPLVITNLVLADFDIWHPWKLFIPKKILNVERNEILTIKEMNRLYYEMEEKKQIPKLMQERGLSYIDNTSEEIKDLVEEMIGRLMEAWVTSEEDEMLQRQFWKGYPKYLKNDNVSQLNIPISEDIKMRVGAKFLKNNLSLLTDTEISQVKAL